MATNKEDRSFKTLINRETTDSDNKFYFNEFGADTINVHSDDIWSDTIPYNDPPLGIALGRVEQQTLFALTVDPTVPNSQSWKAGTKDWISPKYGDGFVAHLFDGDDVEIFPTDPLDWFFDYQTGILTFNGTLTRPTPLKISGYRYIGNKGAGGGSQDLDILYSLTPLAATVDYDDLDAVDPPADTYFATQDEIDDFLTTAGATSFKHIEKLWDALPVFIFHPITIELAATVHRPASDAGNYAFQLNGKYFSRDGNITFNGATSSTWIDIVAAQTITAHQALGSYDPWVQVAGTPFAGQDLKGLFAVFDTGQACIIHDHDDSTLFVLQKLSPTPIDGVTTVRVCRPSTVLQNSLDGITQKSSSGCMYLSNDADGIRPVKFVNCWLQSFGAQWHVSSTYSTAYIALDHCLFDIAEEFDTFGFTCGRAVQATNGFGVNLTHVSFRGRYGINDQSHIYYADGIRGVMINSYMRGGRRVNYIETDSFLNTYFCVFEDEGWSDYYGSKAFFRIGYGSSWSNQQVAISTYEGKRTTFRTAHDQNAFRVIKCIDPFNRGFTHGVWFEGFQVPIVLVDDSDCDLSLCGDGYPGWQNDGVGNSDVGIEVIGGGQKITLGPGVDISGTAGDIRLEGIVGPYTDLGTYVNPLITQRLNIVSKD